MLIKHLTNLRRTVGDDVTRKATTLGRCVVYTTHVAIFCIRKNSI